VEHVYERAGTFVATLSVTDKHLEDQGRGVAPLARTTVRITVNAFPVAPPEPSNAPTSAPVILSFTAGSNCDPTANWTTANATSATLNGVSVPVSGSTTVINPPLAQCTLIATGPGGTATQTIGCGGGC
jgi:hypothetical protein